MVPSKVTRLELTKVKMDDIEETALERQQRGGGTGGMIPPRWQPKGDTVSGCRAVPAVLAGVKGWWKNVTYIHT